MQSIVDSAGSSHGNVSMRAQGRAARTSQIEPDPTRNADYTGEVYHAQALAMGSGPFGLQPNRSGLRDSRQHADLERAGDSADSPAARTRVGEVDSTDS